eukprot:TRINITY_DN91311_c0_g1_i1.p1 TRINITY_DN91311_c0_g1~~TRINITY_DN91311_c0_g1_i1.p1  ORF type:complete len:891 (+),score=217.39 TRINITY_DN91311_c0_g1_i1:111-2783(+)
MARPASLRCFALLLLVVGASSASRERHEHSSRGHAAHRKLLRGGKHQVATHVSSRHSSTRHSSSRHSSSHAHKEITHAGGDSSPGNSGAPEGSQKLTLAAALNRVPPKLADAFSAFQSSGQRAGEVLDDLNKVYGHAQSVKDSVGIDCAETKRNYDVQVDGARADLVDVEGQLTRAQDRMQELQATVDRSQASIHDLQTQFKEHRQRCDSARADFEQELKNLSADLTTAEDLVTTAIGPCNSGLTPPNLVECTFPDGDIVPGFEDQAYRLKAAKLSKASQQILTDALDSAIRGAALAQQTALLALHTGNDTSAAEEHGQTSLLSISSKSRHLRHHAAKKHHGKKHQSRHHHHGGKSHHHHSRRISLLGLEATDEKLCTPAKKLTCPDFVDNMQYFAGSLDDLMDERSVQQQTDICHCSDTTSGLSNLISQLKVQANDANVALANLISEETQLRALQQQRQTQLKDVAAEAEEKVGECRAELLEASTEMCSMERLWDEFKASASGKFLGDCEVTEWVPGPCSQECGRGGGVQNWTRRVISPGGKCPSLVMTRACNDRPCPEDGSMGAWYEWSECTKVCGGGTRTRRRVVEKQPKNGGLPTAETFQEELCNTRSCDADCKLGDWTAWSECSTACQAGHRLRTRPVAADALGKGGCPAAGDAERRQAAACNVTECNTTAPKCASPLDAVFLLDESGSVSQAGFVKIKAFLTKVLARMLLKGEAASDPATLMLRSKQPSGQTRVGFVSFGTTANLVSDMSTDRTTLVQKLEGSSWRGGDAKASSTNTAAALAVARQIFERQTAHPGSTKVVVVVTDGPPSSERFAHTMIERLKDSGVRIMFVALGRAIRERPLRQMASWPEAENVLEAETYVDLDSEVKATELLVKMCPVLSTA